MYIQKVIILQHATHVTVSDDKIYYYYTYFSTSIPEHTHTHTPRRSMFELCAVTARRKIQETNYNTLLHWWWLCSPYIYTYILFFLLYIFIESKYYQISLSRYTIQVINFYTSNHAQYYRRILLPWFSISNNHWPR